MDRHWAKQQYPATRSLQSELKNGQLQKKQSQDIESWGIWKETEAG